MQIRASTAEYGLLHLLVGYLDNLEIRIKADQTEDEFEKEINRTLLIEIERKRNVFRDGMKFLDKKDGISG